MNRYEFYGNLNKFKQSQILKHSNPNSNYGNYYNKIDNYYSDGTARYFTKAEWDAYVENQKRNKYEEDKKKLTEAKKSTGASAQAIIDADARNKWEKTKDIGKKSETKTTSDRSYNAEKAQKEADERTKWEAEQNKNKKIKVSHDSQNLVGQREAAERAAINKNVAENQQQEKELMSKLEQGSELFNSKIEELKPELEKTMKLVMSEIGEKYLDKDLTSDEIKNQLINEVSDKFSEEHPEIVKKIKDTYDNIYGTATTKYGIYDDITNERYTTLGVKMLMGVLFATLIGSQNYFGWALNTNTEERRKSLENELRYNIEKFTQWKHNKNIENTKKKAERYDNATGGLFTKSIAGLAKLFS